MTQPAPAPGWYPDPKKMANTVRYWDGAEWTQAVAPQQPQNPSPGLSDPRHAYRAITIVLACIGVVALFIGLFMMEASTFSDHCEKLEPTMQFSKWRDCMDDKQAKGNIAETIMLASFGILALSLLVFFLTPKPPEGAIEKIPKAYQYREKQHETAENRGYPQRVQTNVEKPPLGLFDRILDRLQWDYQPEDIAPTDDWDVEQQRFTDRRT